MAIFASLLVDEELAPQLSRIWFTYKLVGAGWARVLVSNGGQGVEMMPSYISDALGDLTWAVVKLLEGSPQQIFEWWDEPGRWRWMLSRQGDVLDLLILRLEDRSNSLENERGNVFFHESCKLRRFANQLNNQLQKLHNDHGLDDYRRLWNNHPFPLANWQRLMSALSQSSE
jgi:hypothetical protein